MTDVVKVIRLPRRKYSRIAISMLDINQMQLHLTAIGGMHYDRERQVGLIRLLDERLDVWCQMLEEADKDIE